MYYQLRWDKETSAPNIWDADGAFGDEVALIPIILSDPLEQKTSNTGRKLMSHLSRLMWYSNGRNGFPA